MEIPTEIYPLTSLQIGDIQSYLSRSFLYFAPVSNRLLILVDNRPWLMNKHSRSTRIWQLMVTKYRISPFTNTKALHRCPRLGSNTAINGHFESTCKKSEKFFKWFSVIDATKWQEKSLFPLIDLSKALHGFIVFEVSWKDVRGINYLNELQTDTSVALEVKSMKKWEFSGLDQALSCISLWFSGTVSETLTLLYNLKWLSDMDISTGYNWNETSLSEFLSEGIFFDAEQCPINKSNPANNKESCNEEDSLDKDKFNAEESKSIRWMDLKESNITSTQYTDTLLLFRFSDSNLPSKLKQIITLDLRLLTLLESGLPSWVIFFQSYPLFCHFYRPWMRPLARTLYILISLVTVIIGFYDLYKNIPLLKATVAHLCGPLFDWIEAWDMISRIRYLGTMLFLQNFEKAIKWFLMMMRAVRPLVSLLTKPFMGPLLWVTEFISPIWNLCAETGELFFSAAWIMMESLYDTIAALVEDLLSPFELLYSYVWSTVTTIYPMLCSIWQLFLVPIRFSLALANYMASLCSNVYDLLRDVWQSASGVALLITSSGAKPGAYKISIWRSLWNDLFSQVFRAIRSIINGFIAFFTTCNRHRLSIYSYMRAFLWKFSRLLRLAPYSCPCRQTPQIGYHQMADFWECDRCK